MQHQLSQSKEKVHKVRRDTRDNSITREDTREKKRGNKVVVARVRMHTE